MRPVVLMVMVCADLLPVAVSNVKPPALAVKRINWEKLERVDENTVWAKVSPINTRSPLTYPFVIRTSPLVHL